MRMIFSSKNKKLFLFFIFNIICLPLLSVGAFMESDGFKVQSDSLNTGGTDFSSSPNFLLSDTLGEIATGFSESDSFKLHAGYRQMQESVLSLSSVSDINMPDISGLLGGESNASAEWTVTTDSPSGYSLSIKASTSPAMKSADDSFADYSPQGQDPDFEFAIDPSESAFAISIEGVDTTQSFKDNGSVCNAGALNTTDKCWDGLSLIDKEIARRTSGNHPSGTATTVKFRAKVGTSRVQTSGEYSTIITVTATVL